MEAAAPSSHQRSRRRLLRVLLAAAALTVVAAGALVWRTAADLRPIPEVLPPGPDLLGRPRFTARDGTLLSITYRNRWNVHDVVPYHEVPELLRQAFVVAEDQRFFEHHGLDWRARVHAMVQNLLAGRVVRGASTLTEQAVRILHPRPRTVWSRWLEGIEAARLEERFSKDRILELYLNQVPYARNRRGVAQAARAYFGRDLDTLDSGEMLALAVLVRSPSRLDPERGTEAIRLPVERLARRLRELDLLSAAELEGILAGVLRVVPPELEVDGAHFVRFAERDLPSPAPARPVRTTLDASLQGRVRRILDRRIEDLRLRGVRHGAALVIDHTRDEILAWVSSGGFDDPDGGQIDKVLTLRQPGSTLKPFAYALALEHGWTAATLLDDSPLAEPVGHGLHSFRNYSRVYYGPLRLREALGNSLNIPAVRAVKEVGRGELLERLRRLGFDSLTEHPDFYGDGLALGTGEVSLLALSGAYAVLARGGVRRPLRWRLDGPPPADPPQRIFDPEVSSLIADILADPDARRREFGSGSVLELSLPVAVKTGTSNDYRDAWTVGFSHRYTVGVWMGDLDREPMKEVTGSAGPALVLRSIFAELHRHGEIEPLFLSRRLVRRTLCRESGLLAGPRCPTVREWFREDHAVAERCPLHPGPGEEASPVRIATRSSAGVCLSSPTPGLHMALDPRIPDDLEVFPFRVETGSVVDKVEWIVDGAVVATTAETTWLWSLERGHHLARARVWRRDEDGPVETQSVGFVVK